MFKVCGDGGDDVVRGCRRFNESLGRSGGIQFLREVPDMMVSGYRFAAAGTVCFLAWLLSCAAP